MKKLFLMLIGSSVCLASCNNQSGNTETVAKGAESQADTAASNTRSLSLEEVWATDQVMEIPESVYYNADEKMLYVSNIVGDPSAKDGKGYISKLSMEGEIITKEWATGLHAPKGMTMLDGKLYVTDVDALVVIDASGKISNRYPVKGAKFLNDPVAADNKILFTDSRDNKIHALENGKLSIWKESGMSNPNGLAYQNGKVLLASNNLEVVSQEGESEVLATGLDAGDGIGLVDDNSYLVSNWHGEVFYIERGKDKVKLLDTKDQKINTADITYIPEENLLLVPTFMDNRVVAYKLKR